MPIPMPTPPQDASEGSFKGERVMLDRERLGTFYRELQTPSRIEANTPTPQVEEAEEDFKSELTQS
jgi:hypothetical protein